MSKSKVEFPNAVHDFYKSNGVDARFFTVGPSATRQEFLEECDINTLMKKYEGHAGTGPGMLQHQDPAMFYADFTDLPQSLLEYHAFMDRAQFSFMSLPASVRKEFDNDAALFVEFATHPDNLEQMRTWGLAPPAPKAPEPQAVRIVDPEPKAPEPAPKAS